MQKESIMGTAGAAAATVTGRLAGGLPGIYLKFKKEQRDSGSFHPAYPENVCDKYPESRNPRSNRAGNYVRQFLCITGGYYICGHFPGIRKWKLQYVSCIYTPGDSAYTKFCSYQFLLIPVLILGAAMGSLWVNIDRSFDLEEEGAMKNGAGYAPVWGVVHGRTTMLCVYSCIYNISI